MMNGALITVWTSSSQMVNITDGTAPFSAMSRSKEASSGSVPQAWATCQVVLPSSSVWCMAPAMTISCQVLSAAGSSQPGRAARISSRMRARTVGSFSRSTMS